MKNFDSNHEFFQLIKKLIALRKQNQALRYGATHVVHETKNILAFDRVHGDHVAFFVTSKNPRVGSDDFNIIRSKLPDGNYTDILTGKIYNVKNGLIPVSLKNGDSVVLSTSLRSN